MLQRTACDVRRSVQMEQKNLDIYGSPPLPWTRARDLLEAATKGTGHLSYFLTTARPDGRPHVAAVGAVWVDGTFYFTSGPKTRKSRDIAKNPAVVMAAAPHRAGHSRRGHR